MEKQSNVPKLRFPEFEGDWEVKKLEDLAIRGSGHTPNKAYDSYYDGNIPWVSLADSKGLDNGFIEKTTNTISEEGIKKSSAVLHPIGSVLLSRDAGIGKSAVMKVDMAVSQHFIVWRPIKGKLSNWFLYYKLQIHKPEFERIAIGNTIKTIGLPYFKTLSFVFPQLPEQQKIANFLSTVDEKLQALKKKKSLLETYKKGVMQKLFSQQIRFKDDEGNDFKNWEVKKLGEILTIGSGKDYKHLKTGEVPVFGTGGYMTSVNSFLYDGETVCIGRKGTIDKPMYYNGKIWTVDTLFYTHSFVNTLPKFIFYVFQSINWKEYNEASGVPSLSKSTIEKIELNIPPLPEQTKIANFLTAIDEKINKVDAQIKQTELWRKGLLQRMFV